MSICEIQPFKVDFNVYVPILKKFYKIIAADDINKIIGWNAGASDFTRGATSQLNPATATGYQPSAELNPSEDELLQITEIGINSPHLSFQLKQPTGVDRLGTPAQAIGDLDGVISPVGGQRLLHFLYVVANKQPSLQVTNNSLTIFIRPQLYITGYRYKWEMMDTAPPEGKYQIVHIGGIQ